MDDYIKREDAEYAFSVYMGFSSRRAGEQVHNALQLAKTADVAPVRHGRWNVHEMLEGDDAHCSECGFFLSVSDIFDDYPRLESLHYCPSCGAKMDLKEENGSEGESV